MLRPINIPKICLLLYISVCSINKIAIGQEYGFSKTFVFKGDSVQRFDFSFSNFILDNSQQNIIFPFTSSTQQQFIQNNTWTKINLSGDILLQHTASIPNAQQIIFATAPAINNQSAFYATGHYLQYNTDTFQTLTLDKIDYNLNKIWTKEYALPYTNIWARALFTIDNHIFLVPVLERNADWAPLYPQVSTFANIMKFDSLGNLIWHKSIDSGVWNGAQHAIPAHDGNIIMCGITKGYGTPDNGEAWVMKIDTAGNKLWHKTYNLPGYDLLEKMVATPDGNYICVGGTELPSQIQNMPRSGGRVLKIDENGNLLWDKIINDNPRGGHFWTVVPALNGDIVAFGTEYKYYAYDQYNYQLGSTREPDGWAVRLDANGNEIWNRVFGHNVIPHAHDYLYNAVALPDGGFVASGTTQIADTFWQNGNPQYLSRSAAWIVKLDANGCMDIQCSEHLDIPPGVAANSNLRLYPNPGNGLATILSSEHIPAGASLYITDVMGRSIQSQRLSSSGKEILIDLQSKPEGIYFIRLKAGKMVYSFKYVKVDG